MSFSVTMPSLGASVTEETVTRWLKSEVNEPLLGVSTDKVDTEILAAARGTLLSIKVGEDQTVNVGAELAVIGNERTTGNADAAESPAPERLVIPAPEKLAPPPTTLPDDDVTNDATYVTPLVRKLADEHELDLSLITGSGVGGRIRKADVLAVAANPVPRSSPRLLYPPEPYADWTVVPQVKMPAKVDSLRTPPDISTIWLVL
jgi:pyruvate dehydrogenase E2 component (dihydrolipoamide acetyltransferase)